MAPLAMSTLIKYTIVVSNLNGLEEEKKDGPGRELCRPVLSDLLEKMWEDGEKEKEMEKRGEVGL